MSEKSISEDLQEVFKKHLPETVAGAMKQRLSDLEGKELELVQLKKTHEAIEAGYNTLSKERSEWSTLKDEQASLKAERQKFKEEKATFERDKKVFELVTKLAAEVDKTEHATALNMGLVRNTIYRNHNMEKLVDKNHYANDGSSTSSNERLEHKDETKTEE